jgi:exodeoxyribonuclease VII large subunit
MSSAISGSQKFYSLYQVTQSIQNALQPHLNKSFWVKAELASAKEKGGHFFCELIETNKNGDIIAKLRCNIWKIDLENIRQTFRDCDVDLRMEHGTEVGF